MLAHWDDVEGGRAEAGRIAGLWTDLGSAAGTRMVGVTRIQSRLEDLDYDDGEPR